MGTGDLELLTSYLRDVRVKGVLKFSILSFVVWLQ